MNGSRKMKGFYITLVSVNLLILAGFVSGVIFSGGDIISLAALESALAGAFFSANFGEHWAEAKKKQAEAQALGQEPLNGKQG